MNTSAPGMRPMGWARTHPSVPGGWTCGWQSCYRGSRYLSVVTSRQTINCRFRVREPLFVKHQPEYTLGGAVLYGHLSSVKGLFERGKQAFFVLSVVVALEVVALCLKDQDAGLAILFPPMATKSGHTRSRRHPRM